MFHDMAAIFLAISFMLVTCHGVDMSLMSGITKGKVYSYGTNAKNLDTEEHNCLFSSKLNNKKWYTRCPTHAPCVALQVYVLKNRSLVLSEQHLGCGSLNSSNGGCGSECHLLSVETFGNPTKKYKRCCCHGNLCNNLTNSTAITSNRYEKGTSTVALTTIISSVTFLLLIISLCIVYIWRKVEKRNRAQMQYNMRLPPMISLTNTLSEKTLDHLLRGNLIHQGSHSAIRLGKIHGKPVAVKVFPPRSKMQWHNEKEIYGILGDHPNIAKFLTSEQLSQGFGFDRIIVMSHYAEGSLLNFLRTYTLTWKSMIRFAYCISNGLAYLHGEENKDRSCKVSIAHRDLNSRNVLVKSDGTCVLADFGFALRLNGQYLTGKFPMVGSPRYMAPEVLDGSIIRRDWIAAFKQVDSYALGLLLWELCRRCNEINQPDSITPECLLPYEEELGCGPSIKLVREFVCEQELRPKFPLTWRQDDFTLSYLKNTVVECWDQDGDARLTPSCVLNRLKQMGDFTCTEKNIYKETLSEDLDIFCGDVDTRSEDDVLESQLMRHVTEAEEEACYMDSVVCSNCALHVDMNHTCRPLSGPCTSSTENEADESTSNYSRRTRNAFVMLPNVRLETPLLNDC